MYRKWNKLLYGSLKVKNKLILLGCIFFIKGKTSPYWRVITSFSRNRSDSQQCIIDIIISAQDITSVLIITLKKKRNSEVKILFRPHKMVTVIVTPPEDT